MVEVPYILKALGAGIRAQTGEIHMGLARASRKTGERHVRFAGAAKGFALLNDMLATYHAEGIVKTFLPEDHFITQALTKKSE